MTVNSFEDKTVSTCSDALLVHIGISTVCWNDDVILGKNKSGIVTVFHNDIFSRAYNMICVPKNYYK